MRQLSDWADWMYLPDHVIAHIVPFSQKYSLCGASPLDVFAVWWGTGCWDEIEKARNLPRCTECLDRIPADVTKAAATTEPEVETWQSITRRNP